MTTHLPALDTPPSAGVWVEHTDLALTDDDVAEGNTLGESIDVDDDHDNGLDR